jgi:TP901-1 family phage major tail protein
MEDCNSTQNEKAGKDLLLKFCNELEIDVAIGTADDPTKVLATAHGLVEGDLVKFLTAEIGTSTDVDTDAIYFVVNPTANNFQLAEEPGGDPITFLQAKTDMMIDALKDVGGLRTKTFGFASEAVDISHHGTNQWRKIKNGAGLRTFSVSGGGVYTTDEAYKAVEAKALANELVCLAFVEAITGRVYIGCFKITSLELSGEYNGESAYSISAESSGAVDIFQAEPAA